jgi:hypothetical protein
MVDPQPSLCSSMLARRSHICLSFANGEYAIQFLVQPTSFCFASHLHLFSVAHLAINPLLVFQLTYLFYVYRLCVSSCVCRYGEYYTGLPRQGNQPRRDCSISAALASMHPILPRLAITIVAQAGHLEQL